MMTNRSAFYNRIESTLAEIKGEGLWKSEQVIVSPQGGTVEVEGVGNVLNLCANNYLGLADNLEIVEGAGQAMNDLGYGMASVRFICGTTRQHQMLEQELADYLGTDDSILFAACFDANGGVFEALLGPDDAIVSDSLNHASIIDGIRLCKSNRYRFATRDITDLRLKLAAARAEVSGAILIVTDGVFSMDGYIADVREICNAADEFGALVMVDDCHATGLIGPSGRGTPAMHGVSDRVDILTSTLGKALGGAMGGFVAARSNVINLLRQRARPYLFSNALSPAHVGGARVALRLARDGDQLRDNLRSNAAAFRGEMTKHGFELSGEGHPIIPVMIGDAVVASEFARRLLEVGVYVTAFSFPVVPRGSARIRTQMSAAHSRADVDLAVSAFVEVGRSLGVIGR